MKGSPSGICSLCWRAAGGRAALPSVVEVPVAGQGTHLSPCCVSRCRLRSTFLWKPFPHKSQPKGLKPVCLRLWVMRLELWLKALPHTWHLCGFSPAGQQGPRQGHLRPRALPCVCSLEFYYVLSQDQPPFILTPPRPAPDCTLVRAGAGSLCFINLTQPLAQSRVQKGHSVDSRGVNA